TILCGRLPLTGRPPFCVGGAMIGIYVITVNRRRGKDPYFYVGQAEDIEYREYSHLSKLRRGVHHDRKPDNPDPLQACYNKYGEDALTWDTLEELDQVEQLTERETAW